MQEAPPSAFPSHDYPPPRKLSPVPEPQGYHSAVPHDPLSLSDLDPKCNCMEFTREEIRDCRLKFESCVRVRREQYRQEKDAIYRRMQPHEDVIETKNFKPSTSSEQGQEAYRQMDRLWDQMGHVKVAHKQRVKNVWRDFDDCHEFEDRRAEEEEKKDWEKV